MVSDDDVQESTFCTTVVAKHNHVSVLHFHNLEPWPVPVLHLLSLPLISPFKQTHYYELLLLLFRTQFMYSLTHDWV